MNATTDRPLLCPADGIPHRVEAATSPMVSLYSTVQYCTVLYLVTLLPPSGAAAAGRTPPAVPRCASGSSSAGSARPSSALGASEVVDDPSEGGIHQEGQGQGHLDAKKQEKERKPGVKPWPGSNNTSEGGTDQEGHRHSTAHDSTVWHCIALHSAVQYSTLL